MDLEMIGFKIQNYEEGTCLRERGIPSSRKLCDHFSLLGSMHGQEAIYRDVQVR